MDDLICPDNEFIVIVTGSRDWMRGYQVFEDLDFCYDTGNLRAVIHGGAKGADSAAHNWLSDPPDPHPDVFEHAFPVDTDKHGSWPAAGMVRNREMVSFAETARDAGWYSIIVLAYPLPQSKGTFGMMRECRQAHFPVFNRSVDVG